LTGRDLAGFSLFKDFLTSFLIAIIFRERSIRVFITGDYEFLCSIYGITGANGE